MVIKVTLEGLNIVKARGRWYVYPRGGGKPLLKGLTGSKADVIARLADPDIMPVYNAQRKRDLAAVYGEGTLGALIAWFKNDCLRWDKLSDATKSDYSKAYEWLRPEWDCPLDLITTPALYDVRDRCAKEKWGRFADKMISALSSMFTQAVKRGKMERNPCLGMDKAHKADPNSNREWLPHEWEFVRNNAPMEVLIPCMMARYAGLAGQTIVGIKDRQFVDHPKTGKAVQYTRRKNNKAVFMPVLPPLIAFLAERKVERADGLIAIRDDGSAWETEQDMQTRVSHWLRDCERDGKIGAGTTLHGLRVTYSAWWRRNGATPQEVAVLIGDKSPRMGEHYTRHVEDEVSIIRAFDRIKNENGT
jgi:integrase